MWNLPPPPGFHGLHPDKPLMVYHRHLPHWRQDGATYFVTLRLADSLPQSKLNELAELKADWKQRHPKFATLLSRGTALLSRPGPRTHPTEVDTAMEQLARLVQERIEGWLDQGMGNCVLKEASMAAFLVSALQHFDGDRYELDCYVIMSNHAHVIGRPLMPDVYPLEAIVGSWKKYSARRINGALTLSGELWQDESYDRILRDEEHLWRAIQYVGANPDKARLPRESCPLWIRPHWVELGWSVEAQTDDREAALASGRLRRAVPRA
jgi:hypothetical protein